MGFWKSRPFLNWLDGRNANSRGRRRKPARQLLNLERLEDRTLLDAVVTAVNPSLARGTLSAKATSLQIAFSEPVIGGGTAANYELRSQGADGLLGSADDAVVALAASGSGSIANLTFAALPEGIYRLTFKDTITDSAGNRLDGDANGTAGGNYIRDFVGEPAPKLTLTSPNGFAFDAEVGGFGAGQLVQGSNNAFDGLNRLSFGGSSYLPTTVTSAGVNVFTAASTSHAFPPADDNYHDAGPSLTFTADGSPLRVGAALQVSNGTAVPQLFVRLTLDGGPLRRARYVSLATGTYTQVVLDELLAGLTPGEHTVRVQVRNPFAGRV